MTFVGSNLMNASKCVTPARSSLMNGRAVVDVPGDVEPLRQTAACLKKVAVE